ncbi:antibiotic biosynthesis monooxygenase family protein [Desertibacillus haloalkaliphilus]|uniref:antibiotic biosynthesis monooxygenase family protein n=1 Tax=Desertibacillus haloalkaliphilus TaxID=1328930 RepID=UPI001C26ADAE|nr:antibiotic biosynthesis monooxygenase family protein [Desertibacillus haloalkaliphilus]MBU8908933.1 antibiotic biosynthesis monooxygenase [Desertibacillus haloalkaliphilus]
MYVVMNELYVPKEAKDEMIKRFGKSADNMTNVPGCLEFLFLNHEEEDGKQIVFTKWESKEAYEAWVESDAFKKAHKERRESKEKSPASGNQLNAYEVVYHTS